MKDMIRHYSSHEVSVKWQPKLCVHSAVCAGNLPQVFRPNEHPWVDIEAAEANKIIETVKMCPSGALSIESGV